MQDCYGSVLKPIKILDKTAESFHFDAYYKEKALNCVKDKKY